MNYSISTVQSDSKKNVYIFEKAGKKTPLNSLYSPEKEAERFLKKISPLKNNFVIILGYGNGELLEQLVNSDVYKRNMHFLFIEPFQEVKRSDSQTNTFICNTNKLSFMYYKDLTSISIMEFLSTFIGIPTSIQIHPNYIKIDEPVIKKCFEVIKEGIKTKQIVNNTEAKYAVDWIIEPLLNIENTSKAVKINNIKGKFEGQRAILVASGPSLKNHIDFLKENNGSFHIFSVGSALRALLENGIEPDYVLSMDTSSINYETHFKGIEYSGTLIFETMSNSNIQNHHKGPLVVSRTNSDHVSSRFIEGIHSFKYSSPSVAVFTLQVIAYLGFSEVYLVGQDLALVNGEYYAEGVKHHGRVKSVKEELMVINNQGNQVGTTRSLKIFLDTLEALIKQLPADMEIFNLSEHGARIEGAMFIHENMVQKGIKNVIEMNENPPQSSININEISKDFTGKLKNLQNQILEARKNVNRLLQMGVVTANDMPKVVNDFRKITKHSVLEEILLSNLTFMFKTIINKFKMFDLKKKYTSHDYIELITELEKFYSLIIKFCAEIVSDERLARYK